MEITRKEAEEHPCPKCGSLNVTYVQFAKYHCLNCGVYYPAEYRYKITEAE
jgi:ribosomal protein L37AE/L43A